MAADSLLTGESVPVSRHAHGDGGSQEHAFSGTLVVRGAMPARGGLAGPTDAEMRSAVVYMVENSIHR